ncbi:HAD family hydrolase [Microbacterium sp. NPDC055683]
MTRSSRRRIVFLDIDGTILDHDGTIPASTIAAIRGARTNGHLVFLATGRTPLEIDEKVTDIGFDGIVAGAGAFVEHDGAWVVEHLMPEDSCRRLQEELEALGLDYVLQGREYAHPTPGMQARLRQQLGLPEGDPGTAERGLGRYLGEIAPLRHDLTAKAVFSGDDLGAYDAVVRALGAEFTVITGTIPGMGTASGEVSMPGVTKGSAIVELLDRLDIDIADAVAIGDNNNDLEMLEAVGLGIAMGNGTLEAKEAADEVTDPLDEGGLANAFRRHGLI